MSNDSLKQGSEQRNSILPSMMPSGLGLLGSPYNPADAMPTPPQIGVNVGDSMGDVVNGIKGVAYYADTIGFGAPSSGFTQGMGLKPLGVNYFIKTGKTCSNGAEMWNYFNGIPQGNAMGSRVKEVMSEMGLPPLQGLAPGMIEDAENALNPGPLLNTLLGSGYPQCKLATLPVGDAYGRIASDDGVDWVGYPETAVKKGDSYYQTRWIQDTDTNGNPINLTRDQWSSAKKTYNYDGTPVNGVTPKTTEGFVTKPSTIAVVGVLCILAMGIIRYK